MAQLIRHPEILELARRDGIVTVDDLAEHFGVTVQTIRKDLGELAEAGRLERVHGGAVLPSGTSNLLYEERRALNMDAKRRIAAACAAEIPEGASLFLNIGTTTEAVARALLHHRDILVVTNNLNIANILTGNPDCEIVLAGGTLRRADGGLVGPMAEETVGRFKLDYAVIGCSAVDVDGDLLDYDIQEVSVSRAIIRQARRTFLVADRSKFSRTAPARISSVGELAAIHTDVALPEALASVCAARDVRVHVAPA